MTAPRYFLIRANGGVPELWWIWNEEFPRGAFFRGGRYVATAGPRPEELARGYFGAVEITYDPRNGAMEEGL